MTEIRINNLEEMCDLMCNNQIPKTRDCEKDSIIKKVVALFENDNAPEDVEKLKTDLLCGDDMVIDLVSSYLRANNEFELLEKFEAIWW